MSVQHGNKVLISNKKKNLFHKKKVHSAVIKTFTDGRTAIRLAMARIDMEYQAELNRVLKRMQNSVKTKEKNKTTS